MKTNSEIILNHLMQECGEIVQVASKYDLFGPESYHPNDELKTTNKVLLAREVGNLLACIELLGTLPSEAIEFGFKDKLDRLKEQLTT